ncbi:potassium channel family protein [Pseudoalteromonas rubra]|uniref:Potassium channel domain-containing protein n=1 Tax=Pseudoalteromonas rubra TaxID=43658 RepID=A0A0U3GAZ5_9GAMM|nr:potassium channel family protein [Pseudoalteromonas rubra]ALU41930.1 hypothetical protein AT705_02690 [Pseudoalteromonas rubra]
MANFFRTISSNLGRVPSSVWALGYFVVIIGFAFLYLLNSRGFYHSTSHAEFNVQKLESEFSGDIKRYIDELVGKSTIQSQNLSLVRFNIQPGELKDISIGFSIVVATNDGEYVREELALVHNYELEPSCEDRDNDGFFFPIECHFYATLNHPNSLIFDSKLGKTSVPIDGVTFFKWKDLADAIEGQPIDTEGQFLRMLYLSVVTITTLGYGDIVPTTELNRFLVGLEALLGIVLAGLFLNSLARERD